MKTTLSHYDLKDNFGYSSRVYTVEFMVQVANQIMNNVIHQGDRYLLSDVVCETVRSKAEKMLESVIEVSRCHNASGCCFICRKQIFEGEASYVIGQGTFIDDKFRFGEVSLRLAKYLHTNCLRTAAGKEFL